MKRVVLALAGVILLGGCAAKETIERLAEDRLPRWELPRIQQTEWPNGLRLYLLPDAHLPLFQVTLWIAAGEAYVGAGQSGLAELTAALLVTGGTKSRSPQELDDELAMEAIHLSSEAGRETIQLSLSCLADQQTKALQFLHAIVWEPRWDVERFLLAKQRALEALRRLPDQPQALLSREFRKAVYGETHPWGHVATLESVPSIGRADLVAFYEKYFVPNRMIMTVAGDFDPNALSKALAAQWGAIPAREVTAPVWPKDVFPGTPQQRQIRKELTQAFIAVGHRALERHHPQRYAYSLLHTILGGDVFTSRLGKEIRNELGLAYGIYSQWESHPSGGMFKIDVETKAANRDAVLAKVRQHVQRLRTQADLTEEELARAKETLLNQYIFWFESPFALIETKAKLDLLGFESDYLENYPKRMSQVDLPALQAAARQFFDPEHLTEVVVGP